MKKCFPVLYILVSLLWSQVITPVITLPLDRDSPSFYNSEYVSVLLTDKTYVWDSAEDFSSGIFEHTEVVSGTNEVKLQRRWSANIRVDDTPGGSQWNPILTAGPDDTLYAVWSNGTIRFARSTDDGQTWSASVKVNDGLTGSAHTPSIAIATDGTIYIVWCDSRNGDYDLYSARSSDKGQTWSSNIRVDDNPLRTEWDRDVRDPSLAIGLDSTLYVVWEDARVTGVYDKIYFARSSDGGQSWSANVQVSDATFHGDHNSPSLNVNEDGTLYVVWPVYHKQRICFARSTDSGQTWSENILVNTPSDKNGSLSPSLALWEGGLAVAWSDNRNGDNDIYLAYSTNNGLTWSADTRVNDLLVGEQRFPSLVIDKNGIFLLAWEDNRGGDDYDIYFAMSSDRGTTWSISDRINDTISGEQNKPSLIARFDGKRFIAWQDSRGGIYSIYMSYWPDATMHLTGTYTAISRFSGSWAAWDTLIYTATIPSDTSLAIEARVGNTPSPDVDWSEWVILAVSSSNLTALPSARYLQWRAVFSSTNANVTPLLEKVTIYAVSTGEPDHFVYLPLVLRIAP